MNLNPTIKETTLALESVAQELTTLSNDVNSISNKSNDGLHHIEELIKHTGNSASFAQVVQSTLSKLESDMKEITKILKSISDIANSSNMLSLNARIESSRSENSPFRVISEEMTSISNKTKELNLSATILINNAIDSTNSILQVMNSVNECLESQGLEINHTVKSFKEINENINSVNPIICNLASISEEVLASMTELTESK